MALFRPEEEPALPADGKYAAAALMLELGMSIAAADGEIEEDEVDHIASFLESQFLLDPPDVRRLEALKRVFLGRHPSIGGIGKRLKATLDAGQLESVGEFLVGVAASNGAIDKKEVAALRSAYRALGIAAGVLDRTLEEYSRSLKEPVEVVPATGPSAGGEAIPPRPSTAAKAGFMLDPSVLERLMRETEQVAKLLAEAIPGDEPDDPPPAPIATIPPAADPRLDGLEARHASALSELIGRPSWTPDEFEEVVRRHSLMPSGAMDGINDWAYDRFDDPILEEDGGRLLVRIGLLAGEK
ncbi:tellurite resistance TerB C-terminal domain-containing protein [Isosphaeraceae bacterium EP7]